MSSERERHLNIIIHLALTLAVYIALVMLILMLDPASLESDGQVFIIENLFGENIDQVIETFLNVVSEIVSVITGLLFVLFFPIWLSTNLVIELINYHIEHGVRK